MSGDPGPFRVATPEFYDSLIGPILMEPHADDLARRLGGMEHGSVLEIAAGTGIVTRALDRVLPPRVSIVATDLSGDMIEVANRLTRSGRISWDVADAADLPYEERSFDAVLCQFGVMFFPDRLAAFKEARRVLRPGRPFIFNVWDRLQSNEVQWVIAVTLARMFPGHEALFEGRAAFSCHDAAALAVECREAGFEVVESVTLNLAARAPSAISVARAFCWGSAFGAEALALDPGRFPETEQALSAALEARFGSGTVEATMTAHVVTAIA